MNSKTDLYHRFQQEGWQRAAAAYDSAWRGLTRPFALDLVRAAGVTRGTRLLDLACGPGYAAEAAFERGAIPLGVDFSSEMIRMAKLRLPLIRFCEGDAQALEFQEHSFDAVIMNFGLPHVSDPGVVLREARRVLKPGGIFGFTVWAGPESNPGSGMVHDAVRAYADLDVPLPPGPDYFIFGSAEECGNELAEAGFKADSLVFQSKTRLWEVPSPSFLFEAELHAGVRTSAVLRAQRPEVLLAIQKEIERSVLAYRSGPGYAIPFTAHVIAVKGV
jgi:SAM-dependent methyltransferase